MYASPMIVEVGGIRQVVSMGQKNIFGVSAADGSSLWRYPWAGEGGGMQAITPTIYDGHHRQQCRCEEQPDWIGAAETLHSRRWCDLGPARLFREIECSSKTRLR